MLSDSGITPISSTGYCQSTLRLCMKLGGGCRGRTYIDGIKTRFPTNLTNPLKLNEDWTRTNTSGFGDRYAANYTTPSKTWRVVEESHH